MKMTKILMGAVVAATMMFSSCMIDAGAKFIKVNENYDGTTGDIATAKVDYTNESGDQLRGMKFMRTKRSDMVVKIIMKNQSALKTDPVTGVMGVVFNAQQDPETKLWNFMLLGVRNEYGTIKHYVSHYYNIAEADFAELNFGAHEDDGSKDGKDITKKAYDASCETPYEVIIIPVSTLTGASLKGDTDGSKTMEVAIELKALEDGSYSVKFYDGDALEKGGIAKDATALSEKVCTPAQCQNTADVPTSKISNKIGYYANIYKDMTMEGEWGLWDISGNPIAPDFDSDIAANPIF